MATHKAHVIIDGAMASTNTLTSAVTVFNTMTTGSYQMVWTGTPTGNATSWILEVSNNYDPNRASAATWTVYTLAVAPTNPAGSATNTGLDLGTDFPWGACRLKYVNASGTGVLQVYFVGKGNV
jgi:hypothetical protein